MTTKHTPGPLTVRHAFGVHYDILTNEEYRLGRARGEKNAKLMAAAPQLLEALWVCMEHNRVHYGESHNTVMQARSAISKAKGETL